MLKFFAPVIPLLRIYHKEIIYKHTKMLIILLFIIMKIIFIFNILSMVK
jgi:hypothetical protein